MRKVFLLSAALAAAASFIVAGTASGGPAEIIRVDGSIWFDGNGTPVFVPDANVQIVITNNNNGNINVRATGTLPEGSALPDMAQHYDNDNTGFVCGFGGTTDFQGVTTPSGRFSFQCKAP